MTIDWAQIKDVDDLLKVSDGDLYDDTPSMEEIHSNYLMPDLSDSEIEDAMFWARYMRGIMLVTGPAGSGKGLFGTMLAWKMRRYFGKTVLLDYRPRRPFGLYHPFNEGILAEQLARMTNVAVGQVGEGKTDKAKAKLEEMARNWIANQGQVFLKNSVLVLDEFKRYMYRRRPFKPMGLVLGDLFDIWRHLDILIVGMAIERDELDRFNCLPKLTTEVRCTWLSEQTCKRYGLAEYSAKYTIYPLRYVGTPGEGVLETSGIPERLIVEGGKPKPELDGKRWVDLYNTKDAKDIYVPKSMRQ